MPVLEKHVGRPKRSALTRVRIRLCSNHCSACIGGHRFTEPLDATRIDGNRVRITQPHPLWYGAEIGKSDFEFCEESP